MKRAIYILSIAFALVSCGQQTDDEGSSSSFETMEVTLSNITLEQSYSASIEGRQSIKIIPRIEGYLSEIKIIEGQQVKQGQALFVIDQATYLAEVKATEANLAVAEANVATAQLTYDSRRALHEKNIVSDYDLQTAAASLAMAKAQAQQAAAQLESARANLSYTVLRSPTDGVVGSLPYRIGDYVSPSIQNGLTTVADNEIMYVYFSLSQSEAMSRIHEYGSLIDAVKTFAPVKLLLADGNIYSQMGRVESISGIVDSSTGTVTARAVFTNADGALLSGSAGRLIVPQTLHNVITIPQTATFTIQDKVYVYKVVDGCARSAIINIMPINDGQNYVVTNGLAVGDVIVTKGAGYVKEGETIEN